MCDLLTPEVAVFVRNTLAEADNDEEIGVYLRQLEAGYRILGGEEVNRIGKIARGISAAQVAGFSRLVVHGCAERDDASDPIWLASLRPSTEHLEKLSHPFRSQ